MRTRRTSKYSIFQQTYTNIKNIQKQQINTHNITSNLDFKGPDQWLIHWAPNPALYQAALVIRKTLKSSHQESTSRQVDLMGFVRY